MAISTIFRRAREAPDKTAVVHNDVASSYAQFARRIEACRRYFSKLDLPVGTAAVMDVDCLLDAWVFGFALRSLGLTTCALRGTEAPGDLRVGTIGCVVTAVADNRPTPKNAFGDRPWRSVCVPSDLEPADIPIEPHERHASIAQPGGHIMMTSGTTGAYKRVMRSGEMETRTLPLHAEIYGMSERSVVYVSNFPLWTAGGYGWPLITWRAGGTVVIHQDPDLHGPLLRHEMTHIFATPGTLPTLLRASNGTLRRNDASRLFVTGGALSRATLAAAKRDLTRQVYSALASTEMLTVAITPLDTADDLNWHRVLPSFEVQVVDESDNVLGPGIEGFVRIRIGDGPSGYLDDEESSRRFFHDGYFHSGDIGMFGSDGRLCLRGRASDVVNVFGDKIATGPIEQALQDRLQADAVCVVSIKNIDGDDEIFVIIQTSQKLGQAEIEAAANATLGTLKRLPVRSVSIRNLPRNPMGKIDRMELKRQLSAAIADNVMGVQHNALAG